MKKPKTVAPWKVASQSFTIENTNRFSNFCSTHLHSKLKLNFIVNMKITTVFQFGQFYFFSGCSVYLTTCKQLLTVIIPKEGRSTNMEVVAVCILFLLFINNGILFRWTFLLLNLFFYLHNLGLDDCKIHLDNLAKYLDIFFHLDIFNNHRDTFW